MQKCAMSAFASVPRLCSLNKIAIFRARRHCFLNLGLRQQRSISSGSYSPTSQQTELGKKGNVPVLSSRTNIWQQVRLKLKVAFLGKYVRPMKLDDLLALFSWIFFGHTVFFLVGTTTFVSLVLLISNVLPMKEFMAAQIGYFVAKELGVNISFESAIAPQWKDGAIRFKNVSIVRNKETQRQHLEDYLHRKHGFHGQLNDEEVDGNFTYFHLTIDAMDVSLSFWQWLEGRGWLKECAMKGVRGIVDRRHVWHPQNFISKRRTPLPGDFELDRLCIEDMQLTIYYPNFRPLSVTVYNAEIPLLRKQWLLFDLLCADTIVGLFDQSLFVVRSAGVSDPGVSNVVPVDAFKRSFADNVRLSHLKIDNVKMDMINGGASGPLGWITKGTFDIDAYMAIPLEPQDNFVDYILSEMDEIKDMALDKIDEIVLLHPHEKRKNELEHAGSKESIALQSTARVRNNVELTPTPPWAVKPSLYWFCKVRLNNLKASVPLNTSEISTVNNAMIRPIVAYLNANRTSIPFQFGTKMELKLFDGAWSIYNSGLVDVFSEEIGKALGVMVLDEKERTRQLKKVGLWGIQAMAKNVYALYEHIYNSATA